MASSTLTLSSSSLCATSTTCSYSKLQYPIFSKPNLSFISTSSLSSSLQRLNISTSKYEPFVAKAAAQNVVTPDRDIDEAIDEIKQIIADSKNKPKTEKPRPHVEEIFAVVMIGSRQYIVFPGRWINTQRLKGANANDKIVLNKVLLVGTKNCTYIGKPIVTNAVVHAVVEEQLLDDKVVVFKYKKKKNYRRNIGHRQPITRIKITGITGYEDYPASTLETQPASN